MSAPPCETCGREPRPGSEFTPARRSFRTACRRECPECTRNRRGRRLAWLIGLQLAVGVPLGALILHHDPDAPAGKLFLGLSLMQIYLLLAIVSHELGHACAARWLGWRVFLIRIGSGRVVWRGRCLGFDWVWHQWPWDGQTQVVPARADGMRPRLAAILLGGVAANALIAAAVGWASHPADTEWDWQALPLPAQWFLVTNAGVVITNLWPRRLPNSTAAGTDGYLLLSLLHWKAVDQNRLQALRHALEAGACFEAGDEAGMRKWYAEGLRLFPEDANLLNFAAIDRLNRGEVLAAREAFLDLLKLQPAGTPAHQLFLNNVAYADLLADQPELLAEADDYSQHAFATLPQVPAVRGTRGSVLVMRGKYEAGCQLLREARAGNPQPGQKAANDCFLAVAAIRQGRLAEGRELLARARAGDPKCLLLGRVERELADAGAA